MYKEKLQQILDAIKASPELFDMRSTETPNSKTGACGCIGGFGRLFVNNPKPSHNYYYPLQTVGENIGLTLEESDQLFFALPKECIWTKYAIELNIPFSEGEYIEIKEIKAGHAIQMLENLISGKWEF